MKKLFCLLLALGIAGQVFADSVGFNISGNNDIPRLAGEVADGCSSWTDGIDPSGSNLTLDGTDGLVSVSWNSTNLWHHGPEGTSDEQIYRIYLDDGEAIVVTFDGIGDWIDAHNAEGCQIRIYQNTDWSDNTFPTIDITDGSSILETVQAFNVWREDGARAFVDSGVLSTDTIQLKLSPRDLDARQRSTFSAAKITLVDKFLPVNLSPENGLEVAIDQQVSWQQDPEVSDIGVTYNVYFGTDPNEISAGYYGITPVKTTSSDPVDFFYNPGTLDNSTTYYWKIDAVVSSVVHPGDEYWFVTQPASPRIEVSPASMTVPVGSDTQLSVSAINVDTYQWYKDGVAIEDDPTDTLYSGENTDTLTIYDTQVDDEAEYYCMVDNSLNEPAISEIAELMTQRLVGWWKLDGDLTDSVNDVVADAKAHDGTCNDPNFVSTGIDQGALQFYGDIDGLVIFPDSIDDFNFYSRGYTLSAWVNMPEAISSWTAYVSKEGISEDESRRGFILTATDRGEAVSTLRQSYNDLNSGFNVRLNDWHHVLATYDAATKEGCIYVDGYLRNQATNNGTVTGSPGNLIFGAQMDDGSSAYIGILDDVKIWSYPIDQVSIVALYTDFNPGIEICAAYPEFDVAGPEGIGEDYRDCKVDIYDFVQFAGDWLECNIVPTCKP